jgi:hypothetical protein
MSLEPKKMSQSLGKIGFFLEKTEKAKKDHRKPYEFLKNSIFSRIGSRKLQNFKNS